PDSYVTIAADAHALAIAHEELQQAVSCAEHSGVGVTAECITVQVDAIAARPAAAGAESAIGLHQTGAMDVDEIRTCRPVQKGEARLSVGEMKPELAGLDSHAINAVNAAVPEGELGVGQRVIHREAMGRGLVADPDVPPGRHGKAGRGDA